MNEIKYCAESTYNVTNIMYLSVIRQKGYTYEFKKGKNYLSFVYVKSGKLKYCFPDTTMILEKGDVLFVPKGIPYHAVYLEENTVIRLIGFDFSSNQHLPCLATPRQLTAVAFSSLFESVKESNIRDTIFFLSKAYELIYLMQSYDCHVPKKYLKILPGLDALTKKYYENHPVSHYAALCGMGESNFRKLFKEYTGQSPVDYRNALRIYEAKKLIDSGECNVQEAAYLTGFNNMSFFYDVLKKDQSSGFTTSGKSR